MCYHLSLPKQTSHMRWEGNNIMLMRKNTSVTQQSNRRITGVVKDAIGEPIIGANIVEKGTTNGIITDINGNFSLMVSENAILQISYIGYQTQEIPTKGQTNIQITMKDDAQALVMSLLSVMVRNARKT